MNNRNLDKASELWRDYQYERYMAEDDDDRMLRFLEEHEEECKMVEQMINEGWWFWYKKSDVDDIVADGDIERIHSEYADFLESKKEEAASKEQ